MTLPGYFNRFDPADRYDELLFRASKGLQSAELNEVQGTVIDRLKRIADKVFRDGQVVQGIDPVIDQIGGTIDCPASTVYLRGAMREVPAATVTIPLTGLVRVGVFLLDEEITETQDASLRDPAPNTRNYNEPGAGRLRVTATWGREGQGTGDFYPVFLILDGYLVTQNPAPNNSAFFEALARYDRESNGNYIADGLTVNFLELAGTNNVFTVKNGTGNIQGYKVDKKVSTRLTYAEDPDLELVNAEPDTFTGTTGDLAVIQLNRFPVESIIEVVATLEKTVTLTRGGSSGGQDSLPDVSVLSILEVKQGGTTYTATTDYFLNGDKVDWSPAGAEPAPGSTYTVKYRYLDNVTPTQVDLQNGTFAVEGPVEGTLVLTDYRWKLPRFDRITINQNGEFVRVKGVSTRFNPLPPPVPAQLLALATVEHRWGVGPVVQNDGIHAIPYTQLERIREKVIDLLDLVALERLQRDVSSREPSAKRGVFVDPFIDDDLRDQGLTQTAASAGGILTLPIYAEAYFAPTNNGQDWTLPFTETVILSQTRQTGEAPVNPNPDPFEPVPVLAKLTPAAARWLKIESSFPSFATAAITKPGADPNERSRLMRDREELLTEDRKPARKLRNIQINFLLRGFAPGEELVEVTFDGVPVTPN
jgi:hypothetical protein